jgi:hypothetical protein
MDKRQRESFSITSALPTNRPVGLIVALSVIRRGFANCGVGNRVAAPAGGSILQLSAGRIL